MTAGSLVVHPEIERIVICDFEPSHARDRRQVFRNGKLRRCQRPPRRGVIDDARHFIATTQEKFDIITSDPLDPWMDGAAVLYTVEFYEYARKRLHPGGIVAQWLPLYETDEPSMKSELASFLEVFPEGTIWSSHIPRNGGNDLVMIGQDGPMRIDVDQMTSRIQQNPRLAQSLADVDLGYLITLLSTYFGRGPDLANGSRVRRSIASGVCGFNTSPGFSVDYLRGTRDLSAMASLPPLSGRHLDRLSRDQGAGAGALVPIGLTTARSPAAHPPARPSGTNLQASFFRRWMLTTVFLKPRFTKLADSDQTGGCGTRF